MGADTARITATEFVTPPEFRGLALGEASGGRVGGVRMQLVHSNGTTRLGRCYQQAPLRLLPALRLAGEEPVLLYLMAITPGLLDGDGHHIEIAAEAGTRAVVTGQSALRIHPCLRSFARQQWRVRVQAGAILVVLPGPAIPFSRCRYYQRVVLDLEAGAGLVWGDIWFAGRYARDTLSEQFQFGALVQDLTVRRDGETVFRDRFCWHGPWDRASSAWHFGVDQKSGAVNCACGSLFITGSIPSSLHPAPEECALFTTAAGDTLLRWCGTSEEVVSRLVKHGLGSAAMLSDARSHRPWLLNSNGLGPNHWFIGCGRES